MADMMQSLPVLTDENVWPEFAEQIHALGPSWVATSGRHYELDLENERLVVCLVQSELGPQPDGALIDKDLLELAGVVYDRIGGEWSGAMLRKLIEVWTEIPSPED
jgi:hypothetical protein